MSQQIFIFAIKLHNETTFDISFAVHKYKTIKIAKLLYIKQSQELGTTIPICF